MEDDEFFLKMEHNLIFEKIKDDMANRTTEEILAQLKNEKQINLHWL